MAIRQAAAQFFWEVGGRAARPARTGELTQLPWTLRKGV
jgi:hypothetical protein